MRSFGRFAERLCGLVTIKPHNRKTVKPNETELAKVEFGNKIGESPLVAMTGRLSFMGAVILLSRGRRTISFSSM